MDQTEQYLFAFIMALIVVVGSSLAVMLPLAYAADASEAAADARRREAR